MMKRLLFSCLLSCMIGGQAFGIHPGFESLYALSTLGGVLVGSAITGVGAAVGSAIGALTSSSSMGCTIGVASSAVLTCGIAHSKFSAAEPAAAENAKDEYIGFVFNSGMKRGMQATALISGALAGGYLLKNFWKASPR